MHLHGSASESWSARRGSNPRPSAWEPGKSPLRALYVRLTPLGEADDGNVLHHSASATALYGAGSGVRSAASSPPRHSTCAAGTRLGSDPLAQIHQRRRGAMRVD